MPSNNAPKAKAIVAAGHPITAHAAKIILEDGGNAYDATISAFFAACVAEPVFASLGGGGFLLAQTGKRERLLIDSFVQTPRVKRSREEIEFYPAIVDFGTTRQEFQIGLGASATPGAVAGIFEIHRRFGSIPMKELVIPAIQIARNGVRINAQQAYLMAIVAPILTASDELSSIYCGNHATPVLQQDELLCMPDFANTLEALASEGEDLFYRGEIAGKITDICASAGGHLRREDLSCYRVNCREPLSINYLDSQIITNPPPSSGGILIAFALKLWEQLGTPSGGFGSSDHLAQLIEVMAATNYARVDMTTSDDAELSARYLLDQALLSRYRNEIKGRSNAFRGTTHISIIDGDHNAAAMTVTNGEGCGHVIPGTGIHLNNMLGEEDLNPEGFHRWHPNQRMTSMMAPTLVNLKDDAQIVLGSGGSNRIRTAILQVLLNQMDYGMTLAEAVNSPRVHYENGLLNVEKGFQAQQLTQLFEHYNNYNEWDSLNLFFGGVNAVMQSGGNYSGIGDPRRDGVCVII
jgi:gamma-glutamyltranspeptidase/glutathione hydrolase